jgi:hypothetical protein
MRKCFHFIEIHFNNNWHFNDSVFIYIYLIHLMMMYQDGNMHWYSLIIINQS